MCPAFLVGVMDHIPFVICRCINGFRRPSNNARIMLKEMLERNFSCLKGDGTVLLVAFRTCVAFVYFFLLHTAQPIQLICCGVRGKGGGGLRRVGASVLGHEKNSSYWPT